MHVSIHSRRVARTFYIYYCSLVSATLLGVSWRCGCSSHLSPDKTGTVVFQTIIVYFLKVYLNTLDVSFRWLISSVQSGHSLEGSATFLRVLLIFWCLQNSRRDCLLLRVLSIIWCLQRFWRGFWSGQRVFSGFSLTGKSRASCGVFPSARSSWRSPFLSPGCSLGSCLSQNIPCFLGDLKFIEGLLHAWKQCPGESYPCLLV